MMRSRDRHPRAGDGKASLWLLGRHTQERPFSGRLRVGCFFKWDLFVTGTSVYNINRHDWEHLAAKRNHNDRLDLNEVKPCGMASFRLVLISRDGQFLVVQPQLMETSPEKPLA